MIKTVLPIKGMHCKSCEILISEKLRELPEVNNVRISHRTNKAEIYLKKNLPEEKLRRAIREAGYEVGEEKLPWFNPNSSVYLDLTYALLVLAAVYFLLKLLGIKTINTGSGNPSSLLVVLVVGLTAGVSSCMALVGGLILGISARHRENNPQATPIQNFRPHLFFNMGRIISYTLLGGAIGLIGKGFQLSALSLGILIISVGVVMMIVGLQLTEVFPKISNLKFTLPASIAKILGITQKPKKEYSHLNSALVGALTFFLPCGFTQAMQIYAISTGSFTRGALIMGVFALGTTPGLLSVGTVASVVRGPFAQKFFRLAGLLVIALAVFNISNGLRLVGWHFTKNTSPSTVTTSSSMQVQNGVQVINMTQNADGYSPNEFSVKVGVPVKWVINSTSSTSCSSSIYSSDLKIREFLKPGQNTIEFTPQKTGQMLFTCSMGMYSGTFNVVK